MSSEDGCLYIIFAVLLFVMFGTGIYPGYSDGYRVGQIDAQNQKIYYCLDRQDNGATAWTYHAEGCPEY